MNISDIRRQISLIETRKGKKPSSIFVFQDELDELQCELKEFCTYNTGVTDGKTYILGVEIKVVNDL